MASAGGRRVRPVHMVGIAAGALAVVVAVVLAVLTSVNTHEERDQQTVQYGLAAVDEDLRLLDSDEDERPDVAENALLSTERLESDSDLDGVPDGWEAFFGLDPNDPDDGAQDPDRDGLTNEGEFQASAQYLQAQGVTAQVFDPARGLDPHNRDSDGDGLPDGWEVQYGLDPLRASGLDEDFDSDALPNLLEYEHGCDPKRSDTDGDGLADGSEVLTYGTRCDSADSDEDGMPDGWELAEGLLPNDENDRLQDPDQDGLPNLMEYQTGTAPKRNDTDADGMPDGWEVDNDLKPTDFADGRADPDGDGLTNADEYGYLFSLYQASTDPHNADTDNDGLLDGEEKTAGKKYGRDVGTNPFNPDTDGDGLSDSDELFGTRGPATDPMTRDTDGDRLSDGDEIFTVKTDPTKFDSDQDQVDDGVEWEYWQARQAKGQELLESFGRVPSSLADKYGSEHAVLIQHMGFDGDADGDGLINILDEDSDGDGLLDGQEILLFTYEDDEFSRDPMRDFGPPYRTDPLNFDTDEDGLDDGWETQYRAPCGPHVERCPNPLDPSDALDDADNDGVSVYVHNDQVNHTDVFFYSSPLSRPLREDLHENYSFSQYFAHSNLMEYENNTSPVSADSDCDLVPDGWESFAVLRRQASDGLFYPNPTEFDSHVDPDEDGFDMDNNGERTKDELFTNLEEWWFYTQPNKDNSDGDVSEEGYYVQDGAEVYFFQLQHPAIYREPTVGLPGNGVSEVLAAQTTEREGRLAGCYPDYATLGITGPGAGPPVGPGRDPPTMEAWAVLVIAASLTMLAVGSRPATWNRFAAA